MAAWTPFHALSAALAQGKHNLATAVLKVAFTNTAPDAATASVLADVTGALTTANLAGVAPLTLAGGSVSHVGGVWARIVDDLDVTASGGAYGPLRYAVIYNDSATNKDLIGFQDRGSSVTLADGQFLRVDSSQVSGLLRIGFGAVA